jgi:hypothetical protein
MRPGFICSIGNTMILCAFRTLELQIYPTNMLPDMEFVT